MVARYEATPAILTAQASSATNLKPVLSHTAKVEKKGRSSAAPFANCQVDQFLV